MACPKCGCKVHYQLTHSGMGDEELEDDRLQRCSACNAVFDLDEATDEDDEPDCGPGGHEIDPDNGGCRKCFAALDSTGTAGVTERVMSPDSKRNEGGA